MRRDLPLWVAVLAAQAPDWVDVLCLAVGAHKNAELWSHAFPFILPGAVAAAVIVRLWTRSTGAALVTFGVYLSHPLADLVTGHKPLWSGGPPLGLWLIDRPVPDFLIQASVCVFGWLLYRRSLAPPVRRRVMVTVLLVALLALQGVSDLVVVVRRPFRTTAGIVLPPTPANAARSTVLRVTDAPHRARDADGPRRTCYRARCCRRCSGCGRTSGTARTTPSRAVGVRARTRAT